jgi:Fe2+ or Zn2+ uptake regulation protein
MEKAEIFEKIRSTGGRITPLKKAIIELLLRKGCLICQKDILAHLQDCDLSPDRSSLFRELVSLVEKNIVLKNTISNKDYYEIPCRHHHHLVCLGCQSIEKVDFRNHLVGREKVIARKNNFHIVNHSLEFYGYCQRCQAQKI